MANTVFLVTRAGLGFVQPADADFGVEMFDKLLHTLETAQPRPAAMCFYTDGVRLVVEGSPAVLGLKLLEAEGTRLVACQTCLERFGLADKVVVGRIGGMVEIVKLLNEADKVITV